MSNNVEPMPKKLRIYLESHPGVLDLCYLPVNVAIICFLYDYDPELLPETQTKMYKHFTSSIIIRQLKQYNPFFTLQSLEDLKDEEEKLSKKLCSIAFEMTASSRQVMSHGEFTADSQLSLGLVTTDISAHWSGEYQNSYSFLHLTLQEFLAAYHISKASQEKQKKVIEQYYKKIHMRNFWKFYFGLAKFDSDLLACANELLKLKNNQLFSIQCAYEAKKICITEIVSSSCVTHRGTVCTYDISAIAYVMSEAASIHNAATPTTHLELVGGMVDSNKLASLMDHLSSKAKSCFVSWNMSSNFLNYSGIKCFTDNLIAGYKLLEALNLAQNNIGDDGAIILAEGLRYHNSVKKLILSNNKITKIGAAALMNNTCPFRCLNFITVLVMTV